MTGVWFVTLGKEETRFFFDQTGHVLKVRVLEKHVDCDVSQIDDFKYSVLIAGKQHIVYVDKRKSKLKVLVGGVQVPLRVESELEHRVRTTELKTGKNSASEETIVAPISGKVVKILVSAGTKCKPGQGVIVLEAMKMENELKTEHGGTVKNILVEEGASVETEEPLVTIKVD